MALTVSFDLISDVLVVPRRRPRGISRVISRRASRTGVTRSREERRPFLILEVVFLSSCSYFLPLFLSFLLSMLLFSTFFLLSYSPARAEKKVSDQNKLWVSMVSLVQCFSSRYLVSSFLIVALPCFKEKVSQEETDGNSRTLFA